MSITERTDWREALYQCACIQKEKGCSEALTQAERGFAMLGQYKDAANLRGLCEDALQQCLSREFKEREMHRAEIASGAKKNRKQALILTGAAVLMAVFLLLWYGPFQILLLHSTQQLEAASDYQGALSGYWKMMTGFDADTAAERIPPLQKQLVEQLILEGNCQEAAELAVQIGDEEAMLRAYRAWGKELYEEGRYEEAIDRYQKAQDEEGAQEAYIAWSRELFGQERYSEAIEVLRTAAASAERDELLSEYRGILCDLTIGMIPSLNGDIAALRAAGEQMDDINSQLRFCAALSEAGIDPGEVYPDGVAVSDLALKEYPVPSESTVTEISAGKFLVLMRSQQKGDTARFLKGSKGTVISDAESMLQEEGYEVRLMPGELYRLPETFRAGSLEECDLLILAGSTWNPVAYSPVIKKEKVYLNGKSQWIEKEWYYPVVAAVDSVAVYDKNMPEQYYLAEQQEKLPEDYLIRDVLVPGIYKAINGIQNDDNNPAEREEQPDTADEYAAYWGKPDRQYLKDGLAEVTARIAGMPAEEE